MTQSSLPLALRCPLRGSRLIEASAGTGKTFTISALYLRLVLGQGGEGDFPRALLPPEILVVTFTDAATQELRDRIRARLVEAANAFRQQAANPDPIIARLCQQTPPAQWSASARTLEIAAQWMDQAAVSTIHSWCQRMLREHAFDSGSLFEQTLETDQRELRAEVARDYWRQHCYPLAGAALDWVAEHWGAPEALLDKVRPLLAEPPLATGGELQVLIGDSLAQRAASLTALKSPWAAWADELEQLLEQAIEQKLVDGKKLQRRYFAPWLASLRDWANAAEQQQPNLTDSAWHRLSEKGLAEAWKQGSPPAHPAIAAISQLKQDLAALPNPEQDALTHAAGWIAARFEQEQRRRAQMGFDDMLKRLDAALQGENGGRLAEVIRQQFPVAMIDEFQDTDPLQYRIFNAVYRVASNDQDSALLLIGDPKQAIYSFRGADIHTYLKARRDTHGRHENLDTNYRSSQSMVDAVNRVFSLAEANNPRGAFHFRQGDQHPLPFLPVLAQGRKEIWQRDGQAAPALTVWQLDSEQPLSGDEYRQQMAERCATAMVELLRAGQAGEAGFARPGQALVGVRPADMAVLVRTGKEAQCIRQALAARGVRSVYLSDKDSVFASLEAADVLRWLRACADPGNDRLLRAALASPGLGLRWAELERLNQDERYWEQQVEQFHALRRVWLRQGVLPMLQQLLHRFRLPARLLQQADGERRLTNLLHLAELLQAASRELDGEQALIRHLAERLDDAAGNGAEEQVLRLESDAELVKVVTIHKSKGLEYPLVFLPFIAHSRPADGKGPLWLHDGETRRLQLAVDEQALAQADGERLGEDLRLLYVALTRARHACWLGVADLKRGNARASVLHQSALAWLLAGGERLPSSAQLGQWLQAWQQPPAIDLVPAPETSEVLYQPPAPAATSLCERQPAHPPFEHWWIGSYSALVNGQDSYSLDHDVPALFLPPGAGRPHSPHNFPRGPQPGVFLHGLLEKIAEDGFVRSAEPAQRLAWLAPRCQRRSWGEWTECLQDWLGRLLSQVWSLDGEPFSLGQLQAGQYQSEMQFLFAAHGVKATRIDALVRAQTPGEGNYPPLGADQLNGLFKGYIDLVFEHRGRYWVVDYKSNWLGSEAGSYSQAAMTRSVQAHRYDLQYVFYVLALHRQLKARLPGYDYERHVGGAVYWFLRGVDAPGAGLWQARPSRQLIETLDRLFAGQALEATDA
ncbi:exodeoxyribonuclease V subunit beta [Halopseudomonas yangmingensis]|uniref:RecBCD enzyme subunit RecB n=1 Tax=Halopseudomonas yangmingensis TaxID=1720063 RepID=A0A1I4P9G1_9GAMM|nr:exodeoxyribonuclease V subunit beta [Halopseudomonas yangmingensis]SFM24265.1 DNA helicase/exodeoxyribonuclease V, beta subunit [Halopseudomonas yangmingensis]